MSALPAAEALALVRSYHQRTKHRFEAYAAGPGALDWDAQPAAFRHFDGAQQLALPRLDDLAPGCDLHQALQRPFNAPAIRPLPVDLSSIGVWLQLALGVTAWKSLGPDRWAVRANPSSGNLHPVEAYLLVRGIAGLADGIHHYRPECHGLELRAAHATATDEGQQLAIILTSVMWREAWKYGERAFRYCQLDVGHATAALHYSAVALGWSVSELPQIGNATLARLCGIDRSAEFPARRHAETEREEAELMLEVVGPGILLSGRADAATIAPSTGAELALLATQARWHGTASAIDRHPMFRWPVIEEITVATRQDDVAVAATGTCIAVPLVPTFSRHATVTAHAHPTPVQTLLTKRRSAQRFDGRHVMPRPSFAALIASLQNHAASASTALVFFIHRVAELEPGLYLLAPQATLMATLRPLLDSRFEFAPVAGVGGLLRLTPLAPNELQRLARSVHCHQDIAASSCFAVGMLATFSRLQSHGAGAYRHLYRECGAIGQTLYLEAEAHGLRGTGIGCFFDDPVHTVLGLAADGDWQSLYHFTVGLPVEDARIETTPAYADASKRNTTPPPSAPSANATTDLAMNSTTESANTVQCLAASAAARLLKDSPQTTVFDVRDIASYQRGHVGQAMHLSEDRISHWIRRLPKNDPIVIYCYRGHASKTYALMFADFGFTQVISVDGGYESLAGALLVPPAKDTAAAFAGSAALGAFLAAWEFDASDLNAPRVHGLTPLMRAALQGERALVLELIALGADIHVRNHDGNTALWLACVARDQGIVQDLIDAGIDLDNRNDAGATALMYTASSDRPELLALLLEAGADPLLKNFDDLRAVELAASVACLKLLRHTAEKIR